MSIIYAIKNNVLTHYTNLIYCLIKKNHVYSHIYMFIVLTHCTLYSDHNIFTCIKQPKRVTPT